MDLSQWPDYSWRRTHQAAKCNTTLIKGYSDGGASNLDQQCIGEAKAVINLLSPIGTERCVGISFRCNLCIPTHAARLHMRGIVFSTLELPVRGFQSET